MRTLFGCSVFTVLLLPLFAQGENPRWIWQEGTKIQPDDFCYLRKAFSLDSAPTKAVLKVAADDEAVVFLNGKEVLKATGTSSPGHRDVVEYLHKGENVLAIRAHNVAADVAGVIAVLETATRKQPSKFVVTDSSWVSTGKQADGWQSAGFDAADWKPARTVGKLGDKPWGDVFQVPQATAASSLSVLPGFKVDLVHSSEMGEGSWICMTKDGKGRLIISPQADDQPLLRVTVDGSKVKKIEKIAAPIHQAMGLLWAYNSLYVTGHGPKGTGLYRLVDADHNDRFETNELHFLSKIAGEGEHGYHALALGPDKMIYLMDGNHTKLPPVIDPASPHKNFEEELLLPRQWDANGHAVGILAPGGHVLRTDRDGKKWTLVLAGFRNSYDFDFNADGEMFTFDSDMEWDWGLPWYRPTRVNHCVTGAEFGWRSGSAVWPEYYPDSLPATVNIGVGSPTGVKFGKGKNFPKDYRNALYLLDWAYGRVFVVHLRPKGASYTAESEVFVKGKPLNLTSLQFAKDGSMYFVTGGRGTQSGLYRVTYTGKGTPREPEKMSKDEQKSAAAARAVRHKLESYYSKKDPAAIDFAWPYLGSNDRFLSFAARVAIESQDLGLWKDRALAEDHPDAALNALVGLARCGGKDTQRDLLLALKKFPMDSLSLTQKLEKLRVIELSFIRQGKPDPDLAKLAIEKLGHLYPSDNEYLNRELSQVLIYLEAPGVVTKTLALLDKAKTQEEQVHYIFYLRTLKTGWTLEQRKRYFNWFRTGGNPASGDVSVVKVSTEHLPPPQHPAQLLNWFKEAGRDYADGVSYPKYLINIRKDAIASLSAEDHIALSTWIDDFEAAKAFKPSRQRNFVQEWKLADLEPSLNDVSNGRNFKSGKAAFNDAQCTLCHRFGNEGGYVGPELTAVASKYARRDILESILDPSKVVSDQFQNVMIIKKDGDAETGRLIDEDDIKVVVQPNPLSQERIPIQKSDVAERRPSHVSPMPEGLLNQFTKEEILDMLAYIESMGKEKAPNFKPGVQAETLNPMVFRVLVAAMSVTGVLRVLLLCLLFCAQAGFCKPAAPTLTFCCRPDNDLYVALADYKFPRFTNTLVAIQRAPTNSAVLVLADQYPEQTTTLESSAMDLALEKGLRLYIEYASDLPGLIPASPRVAHWERLVVSSDKFENSKGTSKPKESSISSPVADKSIQGQASLKRMQILMTHACHFLPFTNKVEADLTLARVAGYDTAIYGLPPHDTWPILFSLPDGKITVAATKLSGFVSGRYAPSEDWRILWEKLLRQLGDGEDVRLTFTPLVSAAYASNSKLPRRFEHQTFTASADWFAHSHLLVHPAEKNAILVALAPSGETIDPPRRDAPEGDGSLGIMEGYASAVRPDGTQPRRLPLRADCNAESAMVLALDSSLDARKADHGSIAFNLLDFVYFTSGICAGVRANPRNSAYGLIGWGDGAPAWLVANYGDDNARTILATLVASAALNTHRYDERLMRALLANLRTTGDLGFRTDRIDLPELQQNGWASSYQGKPVNYSPHFEAYLWACYLWGYQQTHFRLFLDRTVTAIGMTMKVYPDQWRWQDNLERAHMLLCLAWLVRVQDTVEHREWLRRVAGDLLRDQTASGAIHERLGNLHGGHFRTPQKNEDYGTTETPLLQENGDAVTDQLYTTGFALLGLHEAAGATGDPVYKKAEDRLAEFLCRIQTRSVKLPYLSGTWFRAFDDNRWEAWASSADVGWGAWSLESGWGQAWIPATLALREKQMTIWEMTAGSHAAKYLTEVKAQMLPGHLN